MSTTETTTTSYEFEVFDEHGHTVACGDAATLEEAEREGRHYLAQYQQDGSCTLELRRTEVLSVSALPPFPVVAAPVVEAGSTPAAAEPLWRVLQDAYYSVTQQPDVFSEEHERLTIAAEIRAVRDWLVPEDGPRPGISWPMERAAWDARQAIRAMLTTEADRAERVSDGPHQPLAAEPRRASGDECRQRCKFLGA